MRILLAGGGTLLALAAGAVAAFWHFNSFEGIGGRKRLLLVSVEEEQQMGAEAYGQLLATEPVLCEDGPASCPRGAGEASEAIEAIGARLAEAARTWEAEGAPMTIAGRGPTGLPRWGALSERMDWQFTLIQSDMPNAFALPGGYVAVYTGILPTAETREGLAVIISHEIGHVLARHGAERMSQQTLVRAGQVVVSLLLGGESIETQRLVLGALGAGAQFGVLLPFSRNHEAEADMIGLELMVRACFDPREAPHLWERMSALGGGSRPPEILSTHPNPEARALAFEAVMPAAVAEYERRCST
jgi:metalloendopeptidase OMA1, mitochondrial